MNCPKDACSKCAQNSVKARKVAAYELCGENVPVKSSCPKDADTTKTPCRKVCPTGLPFICTRPRGHKGKHHAHGGRCFAVWGND